MRHKDVIYASNADSRGSAKFLNFVRTISTVSGVSGDAVLTGGAIKGRHVLGN
jgi:hypothetical protein